jgi:predicted transcriptional regulator
MARTVPVVARISPALKRKLAALAKDTGRSESDLVAEAIANYIDVNDWQVRVIKKRSDEVLAGEPGVPHEEVVKWIDSMGTDHELPRPKPRRL